MMRRLILMVALIGAALGFASRFQAPSPSGNPIVLVEGPATTSSVVRQAPTTTRATTTTTTTTTSTTPATTITTPDTSQGGDVHEGSRIYTNWGWVKVEITVVDDVMVDIELVMIPRATKRSEALSLEYEPILREQALASQSPDVDIISGATTIADGYRRSLTKAMMDAGLWSPPAR